MKILRKSVAYVALLVMPAALFAQAENWVYTYNGSGNSYDEANSIVYGADGNIYAAGYSRNPTNNDFTVISLDTAGDTNWTYIYNGSADSHDQANSIVYGADGNIYAAGVSVGIGTSMDFTVISLDTADGDTNWTYIYNGAGDGRDLAYSIIYGADGNIYAAGVSTESGFDMDFFVISLTQSGDTNWTYKSAGSFGAEAARSIVYGADGNIYAAGMSFNADFAVISLTQTGDTNWTYMYDGPGSGWDGANSIIYGDDGNLYAAGYSKGSGTGNDFTVISLDTAYGDTNWTYTYNGSGDNWDQAYSIIYGDDGNLYAAGYSGWDLAGGTGMDYIVISLTAAGAQNWTYTYNGPGDINDLAYSIIYGADGKLYVAGGPYWNVFDSGDFTVISLDTGGDEYWTYSYDGSGNGFDAANSIIWGADGNLYAAGLSTDSITSGDFTVTSLRPRVGDAATVSIDIDSLVPEDTTLYPQATVTNFGTNNETFLVTCTIDPGDYIRNRTVNNLAPGDSTPVTFLLEFTFEPGIYTVTVYTRLTDDENPANDTLEKVIETYDPGVAEEGSSPAAFSFNAPTISKSKTHIELVIAVETEVDLLVYDAVGRLSETLISERFSAGTHSLNVNLNLSSGVYFYNLKTGTGRNIIKKFLVVE